MKSLRGDLVLFYLYNTRFTVCSFYFLSLSLINVNSFAEFFSYRFQSPPCKSFNSGFFFFVVDRKICFPDMMSFHTRSKFFKKLDTSWLRLLNVLGNNPTLAWVLLPNQMYVFSLFYWRIFDFFWVVYLALLSVWNSSSLFCSISLISRFCTYILFAFPIARRV